MLNLSVVERLPCRAAVTASIITVSTAMRALVDLSERVAPSNLSVLLLGETGSGKDVFARHIHAQSRRLGMFVPVNCAALPATLADSELFGHIRGAFTGAERLREGAFEQAHHGTLFLDEIGDLDLAIQGKLLRVLEDGMVQRLGSSTPFPVDVRIVAATHCDLQAAVIAGRFREDLLHRLAGITLTVPPLRDRPEDIHPLIERFLADDNSGCRTRVIRPATIAWLTHQPWRGNVRALRQAVRRACALGGHELLPADFGIAQSVTAEECVRPGGGAAVLDAWLTDKQWRDIEREVIARALHRNGTIRAAARALGLPNSTLADRVRAYGFAVGRAARG